MLLLPAAFSPTGWLLAMSEPMQADRLLEVALFPIPNVVAFPGVVLPLHVFEPRYRCSR